MADIDRSWTLDQIAELVGGQVIGDGGTIIRTVAETTSDIENSIAFATNAAYLESARTSKVAAVIVPTSVESFDKPIIRHPNPRLAFSTFLRNLHRPLPIKSGIHPTAVIADSARVHPDAKVGAYVVVEANSTVGAGCVLYPFSYVGDNSHLGEGVTLFPHAVVLQDVTLGDRTIIASGSVIGYDGFGFIWDGKQRIKIPHIGGVEIGEDVEIGAGTMVDRAMFDQTRVEKGVKLDNLVQVAHNVTIGEHTVIAALVPVGGSSKIGARCMIGGQSAISDHVSIPSDVGLGGRAGVSADIPEPGIYFGFPLQKQREALRSMSLYRDLPQLNSRLKSLESKIAELEARLLLASQDPE